MNSENCKIGAYLTLNARIGVSIFLSQDTINYQDSYPALTCPHTLCLSDARGVTFLSPKVLNGRFVWIQSGSASGSGLSRLLLLNLFVSQMLVG